MHRVTTSQMFVDLSKERLMNVRRSSDRTCSNSIEYRGKTSIADGASMKERCLEDRRSKKILFLSVSQEFVALPFDPRRLSTRTKKQSDTNTFRVYFVLIHHNILETWTRINVKADQNGITPIFDNVSEQYEKKFN